MGNQQTRRAAAPRLAPQDTPPVVVIGAGPTGLSAAYHLGRDAVLVERGRTVGGWCRSIEDHGFTFDFAGHIMFSNDPYVHQLYQVLLGQEKGPRFGSFVAVYGLQNTVDMIDGALARSA